MENIKTLNNNQLLNLKKFHDDLYYNKGQPVITDAEYDKITEELLLRKNKLKTGILDKSENAVKLPYYLGSLDKIKTKSELIKWKEKNPTSSYILMPKLDGVSVLYVHDKSNPKLYTRGNGKKGSDISYLLPYINIPYLQNIEKNLCIYYIRGELVIFKKDFKEKYSFNYSNARNMVTGLLDTKTFSEAFYDIKFISYELVVPDSIKLPSKYLDFLSKYGHSVDYILIKDLSLEILQKQLIEWKVNYEFEIDGIVIQTNEHYERYLKGNPKYQVAFKMTQEDNISYAIVDSVEWNVSMHGVLKPRVKIFPIKLDGVNITYASGFNAKYIQSNKIGPNTEIKITRSGNVIPYILEVIKPTYAQMPNVNYTWNDTNVDISVNINIENSDTNLFPRDVTIKRINHFFTVLDIKYISLATVTKLYDNGYNTILKILSAEEKDFLKLPNIKEKSANRMYINIHNGLKNVKLYKLMAASMIFGVGISNKKLKILIENIPDLFIKPISVEMLNKLEGFSNITSEKILNGIAEFKEFFEDIKPYIIIEIPKKTIVIQDKKIPTINSKNYVFSGFRDKALEEALINKGYNVCNTVTKNTVAVITSDIDNITNKTKKALELNIPIILKTEFTA